MDNHHIFSACCTHGSKATGTGESAQSPPYCLNWVPTLGLYTWQQGYRYRRVCTKSPPPCLNWVPTLGLYTWRQGYRYWGVCTKSPPPCLNWVPTLGLYTWWQGYRYWGVCTVLHPAWTGGPTLGLTSCSIAYTYSKSIWPQSSNSV